MDRIYYFRLTGDNRTEKKYAEINHKEENHTEEKHREDKHTERNRMYPVFRREAGGYEIYYLQMAETTDNSELAAVQSYMQKGIGRLSKWYGTDDSKAGVYLVYEASFGGWLRARQQEAHWQKLWNLPMYGEYKEAHNLQLLLQQIPKHCLPGQLIVLGEAPGIKSWVEGLARHMKEIHLYAEKSPKDFEEMRQHLLSEYGMILKWERSLQPVSPEPALVLDYSGKEKIFIWGIPSGSIWVDMTSMEIRRRALEDRDTGIRYLSLKRFWQEEMLQTLDTAGKILYNTGVN